MEKHITFGKCDEELVQKILLYQEKQNIKTFTEAVRQLCKNGLDKCVNVKINLK